MNYKSIFRSQKLRFKILACLSFVPDSIMLRFQYYIKMGFSPNFKSPSRFTEKIQNYKMNYRNPLMLRCVDKYEVRQYVKDKGLEHILNDCYGVYDHVDEIDLSVLPNQFVAKTTNGGGGLNVILVKNSNDLNEIEFKLKLKRWMKHSGSYFAGREWAYSGIKKPRIIIESLLVDNNNPDGSIEDYKFFCFSGKVFCIQEDRGRYSCHSRNFYTKEWIKIPIQCTYPTTKSSPRPLNFSDMIRIAEILSEDFPFARIDLYNIQGQIYFGEITYYPGSGYEAFIPDSFDFELGKQFIM